jgi:MoaA/NifB/PqqE/SkfB family radical SAM enzyme
MPFCYSPWTNIDISPQGNISPCCKFQSPTPKYTTLDDYISSDFLANIKQEFELDKWPTGCERCRIEELNQIESKRQLDYIRWQEQYKHYSFSSNQFITASIAFGNTCNLKCITCGPYSSSRWQSEYQHIYNKNIQPIKFYKKDFVQEFTQQAPGIVHLDIPGGEPFLSGVPEQKALLQHYIQSGQAPTITIHYTTNATVMPDSEWWQLWQHFKEVEIQLSIDGVGSRFEYIRYPGNWSQVESNVAEYVSKQSQVRLSVSHTVSAYNIYYLDEFFTWCYNQGLPRPWLGRVHNPAHMRPAVWPAPIRNIIADYLLSSQYDDVKVWGQMIQRSNDSGQFETFKTKLAQHDQFRSLDFRNTFPELAKYL